MLCNIVLLVLAIHSIQFISSTHQYIMIVARATLYSLKEIQIGEYIFNNDTEENTSLLLQDALLIFVRDRCFS